MANLAYETLSSTGYYFEYHGEVRLNTHQRLKDILVKDTSHNYFTFWWIDFVLRQSGPVAVFKRVRVTKFSWWKLVNNIPLTDKERGAFLNLPIRVLDSDAFAVTKIGANWGSREVRVERIRADAFSLVTLFNGLLPKDKYIDLSRTYRVIGNPQSSMIAFRRNSQTHTGREVPSLEKLVRKISDYDSLQPLVLPAVPDNVSLPDMVYSSGIRVNKLSGTAGVMDRNSPSIKKGFYYGPNLALASVLIKQFMKKGVNGKIAPNFVPDVSIYASGGRNKKNFNKKVGDLLSSRPVWMCSAISELFMNYMVRYYINFYRSSGVDQPFYLGKSLQGSGWRPLVDAVKDPSRICTHGDYSKWDSTVPKNLLLVALSVFRQSFPPGVEFDNLLRFISFGLISHPVSLLNGGIFAYKRGMPSGHSLTATVNCLVNWALRNYVFSNFYLDDFKVLASKHPLVPVVTCVLGDDFGYVSLESDADPLIRKIGSNLSSHALNVFGMELDPPYVGPFGTSNPDSENSFEFLRVSFTDTMTPTIKAYELLTRVVLPESRKSEASILALKSAIAYSPSHDFGIFSYFMLRLFLDKTVIPVSIDNARTFIESSLDSAALDAEKYYDSVWTGSKNFVADDSSPGRLIVSDYLAENSSFFDEKLADSHSNVFNYSCLRYTLSTLGLVGYNLLKFGNCRGHVIDVFKDCKVLPLHFDSL